MANNYLVAGLGYGDEGKGTIVDFLVRQLGIKNVVRYNGGCQAAHHVVNDGTVHCYSQFTSGSFVDGVESYLSKHMIVDPLTLKVEEEVLRRKGVDETYSRMTISPDCLLTTPMQRFLGQMQELSRGEDRHGSCGMGVGATVYDAKAWGDKYPTAGDLLKPEVLRKKLDFIWRVKVDQGEQIVDEEPDNQELDDRLGMFKDPGYVDKLMDWYSSFVSESGVKIEKVEPKGQCVYEGAQGVLLDHKYGFWPHVTKTDITYNNAEELCSNLSEDYGDSLDNNSDFTYKIGVLRAYSTRHGAGPFVTEDDDLGRRIPDYHNQTNPWQGKMRVGWFDMVAAKYSLDVIGGVDSIALTCVDRLENVDDMKICEAYRYNGDEEISDYFNYDECEDGKIIFGIKKAEDPTHEHQQKLGELLGDCEPIYSNWRGWDYGKYIGFIAKELETPVSIVSFGTEAKDKKMIKGLG